MKSSSFFTHVGRSRSQITNYPNQPRDPDGQFAGGSGDDFDDDENVGELDEGEYGYGYDPNGVSYTEDDLDLDGNPKFSQTYRDTYGPMISDGSLGGKSGLAVAIGTKRGIHVADDSDGKMNRRVIQELTPKEARALGEGIYQVYNGDRESFAGSGVKVDPAGPNPTRDGVTVTWKDGTQTRHEGESGDDEAFGLQEALDISDSALAHNRLTARFFSQVSRSQRHIEG